MKKIGIILLFCSLVLSVFSQNRITVEEYISKYKDVAIEEMKTNKIPASITLAQGILESGCGNSALARYANNHFGIKCKPEWTGGKYYYDDDEKQECFRKYNSDIESYRDHSVFLKTREYYASLFLLDLTDYRGWANGLKKAGYATCPDYAQQLIAIIEANCLFQYDTPQKSFTSDSVSPLVKKTNTRTIITNSDTTKTETLQQKINKNEDDFSDIPLFEGSRKVYFVNGVKYIKAGLNDSFDHIAKDFGLNVFEVKRFNDIGSAYFLKQGDIVFIEAKKKKSETEFHIVVAGETMQSISQAYGIQLKELYIKNRMKQSSEPNLGQKIWLKNLMPIY
ncbi:MAG: glucosaminidase domain-containing protein [Bacteroidota bacterium]